MSLLGSWLVIMPSYAFVCDRLPPSMCTPYRTVQYVLVVGFAAAESCWQRRRARRRREMEDTVRRATLVIWRRRR